MSTRLERLFSRTASSRRRRFGILLAGVIVVPLVVAGFFAGALNNADKRVDTIPAIVVNNDAMVTTTGADGKQQVILAGRLLVTQLTGAKSSGFSWTISNSANAKTALANGSAYAVLTIPKDFSGSIESLQSTSPRQASLSIRTDDAHDYLAGSVAQSVGAAMTGAFGKQITTRYLTAFYESLAGMGTSLSSAADGATKLSSGASGVASGLDSLASGAASAASGASSAASGASTFAAGVGSYTGGVDRLAGGLGQLDSGGAGLSSLSSGVAGYTGAVSEQSGKLAALIAADPTLSANVELQGIAQTLAGVARGGSTLSAQTSGAVSGIQGGIASSASAASQIASGSAGLRSGANGLASGVDSIASGVSGLSTGAASAASGAHQLADGASSLASGLSGGAKQASALDGTNPKATATVIADPVGVTVSRANPINGVGTVIGMVFVPIGLWIGAIAIFLLLRPVTALTLASTASTGRIVLRGLGRAAGVAVAQAIALVALLHTVLGVSWAMLPATLSFAILLALVFASIHHLLSVLLGRVGVVVSIILLALQLPTVGGLFPVQLLSAPFQAISPLLPLTYAVQGMQGIVSGAGGATVASAAVALILFGLAGLGLSTLLVARQRGARAFAFAPTRG